MGDLRHGDHVADGHRDAMTKERLRRYIWLKQECRQLQQYLDRIMNDMASVSSPRLTGMPHANDPRGLDEIVVRYEEIVSRYEKRLKLYQKETLAIEKAIEGLEDPRLRLLLRYKYMDGYKWETIADLMHYEVRWLYVLHGQALQAIAGREE